jgi:hypothetical protein
MLNRIKLPHNYRDFTKEQKDDYWAKRNHAQGHKFGTYRWQPNNQAEADRKIPTKSLTIHNLKDWPTSSLLHLKDDPIIAAELLTREKNKT